MVWGLVVLTMFWLACEAAILWLVKRRCEQSEPDERGIGDRQEELEMAGDLNFLTLVKGDERYVFLYDDGREVEVLRILGRFASNPELSFTWYDAAVMSQKVRESIAEIQRAKDSETPAANWRF